MEDQRFKTKRIKNKKSLFLISFAIYWEILFIMCDVLFDVFKNRPVRVFWLGLLLQIPIGFGLGYLFWRQQLARRTKSDPNNKCDSFVT
jgi:hypothetical protein